MLLMVVDTYSKLTEDEVISSVTSLATVELIDDLFFGNEAPVHVAKKLRQLQELYDDF